MDYLDFSNILFLAMGFNVAYFANADNLNATFFNFLKLINSTKKKMEEIEDYSKSLSSALDTLEEMKKYHKEIEDYLGEDEYINMRYKFKDLKTLISKAEYMQNYFRKVLIPFEQKDNLKNIALVSFLYAFIVVLLSPYKFLCFNESLFIMNVVLSALAIICTILDVRDKKLGRLSYFFIFLFICLCVLLCLYMLYYTNSRIPITILYYNNIFTVLVCFVGAITYTISSVIGHIKSQCYMKRKENIDTFEKIKEVDKYKKQIYDCFSKISEKIGNDSVEINLANGIWSWRQDVDFHGSKVEFNVKQKNVTFKFNLVTDYIHPTNNALNKWGYAGIQSLIDWANPNWNEFKGISITYTSNKDLIIYAIIPELSNSGSGFRTYLPAGNSMSISLNLSDFKQPDWVNDYPCYKRVEIDKSKIVGIAIHAKIGGEITIGSINNLVLNGVEV
jgi:hypothetical protein